MADSATIDFELERLAAEQQFALWHDLVQPLFRVGIEDEARAAFRAEMRAVPVADALLTTCASRAQTFARSMGDVRSSGWDHVVIQLYVAGGFTGLCGDRAVSVAAGDINVLDLNRTLHTRATDFSNLTLILPRDRLPLAGSNDLHGRAIGHGSALAAVIGSHLRSLAEHAASLTPGRRAPPSMRCACSCRAATSDRPIRSSARRPAPASTTGSAPISTATSTTRP